MADLCLIPTRGTVRPDGFIFDRVGRTSGGKSYLVWRSPDYWARQETYHKKRRGIKRSYDRRRRQMQAEKIRKEKAEYYLRNRDHLIEKSRAYAPIWRRKYPAHSRASIARRRARVANATDGAADRAIIRQIYKMAARVQGCTGIKFHVDHVIPVSKGGRHHQDNLQVITARLNQKKSDKRAA